MKNDAEPFFLYLLAICMSSAVVLKHISFGHLSRISRWQVSGFYNISISYCFPKEIAWERSFALVSNKIDFGKTFEIGYLKGRINLVIIYLC